MEETEFDHADTLLEYCAKQMVRNWDNRKYRAQIIRRLHTFRPHLTLTRSANVDAVDTVVHEFIREKKVGVRRVFSRVALRGHSLPVPS